MIKGLRKPLRFRELGGEQALFNISRGLRPLVVFLF